MLHYATALRSANLPQRRAAVKELSQMGSSIPSAALAFLVPLLNDEDETVRNHAADALTQAAAVHPNARHSAVNAVAQMLTAPQIATRMRGAMLAGRLGTTAAALVPALAGLLRDTNLILCRVAADALVSVGAEAAPLLEMLCDDPDSHVRRQAQWALQKLETGKAAPTQLRMDTSLDVLAGKRPTERVLVTPMPRSLQRTQAMPITPMPSAERRRQPRFRCQRDTFYRFATDHSEDLWWKAEISDVSQSGIGILCTRQANTGARLTIDLQEAHASVHRQAVARVAHCQRTRQGWYLGCALVGALVPDELRQLRDTPAGPPSQPTGTPA